MITVKQAEYRAYLASPVWKAKREEALAFHGCVCNRCKEYGNDVHHKTYERVGGDELMEDLEVLCRECHEIHHKIEKTTKTRNRRRRGIHRRAIFSKLTDSQIKRLRGQFPDMYTNVFIAMNHGDPEQAQFAAKLLGCDYAYGPGIVFASKYDPPIDLGKSGVWVFTKEFKKLSEIPEYCVDKSK